MDAVAALNDRLPDIHPTQDYRFPEDSPAFFSWSSWVSPGLHHESVAFTMFGCTRRLLALSQLVRLAAHNAWKSDTIGDKQPLAGMWSCATGRAPLNNLTVNPDVCLTVAWRIFCLRTGLGKVLGEQSERLAPLMFFGLRALTPGVAALQHGYWWARCWTSSLAFAEFDEWTSERQEAVLRTVPAAEGSSASASGVDLLLQAVASAERSSTTDSEDDPLRRHWRNSSSYSRPLLDDWGPTDRALPPVWADLVAKDGGLASAAMFGLQDWMVAADLGIDDLGDLYLTLGRPCDLGGVHMLHPDSNAETPAIRPSDDGVRATAEQFEYVLQHLPAVAVAMTRLLERPDAAAPNVSWVDNHTVEDLPPTLRLPPAIPPLAPGEELSTLNALQGCLLNSSHSYLPDRILGGLPPALTDLFEPLVESGADFNHKVLLDKWHERLERVLHLACDLHNVEDPARAAVVGLPQRGFYPALRVALDALSGRWEPLAAAVLSQRGLVVGGWPGNVAARLQPMGVRLNRCVWPPVKAHTASLMASLFLSYSPREGARYRDLLCLDTSTETLLKEGAAPLEAATALASTIITGFAISYPDRRDAEMEPDSTASEQSQLANGGGDDVGERVASASGQGQRATGIGHGGEERVARVSGQGRMADGGVVVLEMGERGLASVV